MARIGPLSCTRLTTIALGYLRIPVIAGTAPSRISGAQMGHHGPFGRKKLLMAAGQLHRRVRITAPGRMIYRLIMTDHVPGEAACPSAVTLSPRSPDPSPVT